jgi:hypothetical protein
VSFGFLLEHVGKFVEFIVEPIDVLTMDMTSEPQAVSGFD